MTKAKSALKKHDALSVRSEVQDAVVVRQVVAGGGGVFQSNNLIIFSTIGEFMTETLRSGDNSLILTQGFQQPEPQTVPVIEIYHTRLTVNVFPNPATQFVRLVLNEPSPQPLTVALSDVHGRLVATQMLSGIACEMDVNSLPDGVCFLSLSDENAVQGCVKILKTSTR